MILKSFYRKKTTKIYLLIFTLIFTVLGVVIIGKNNYLQKADSNYSNSFMYVSSNTPIDFNNIDNVIDTRNAVYNGTFYLTYSDDIAINENEVVMPSFLKNSYKINDTIEFQEENNTLYFTIKDYYEMEYVNPVIYINKTTLDKLISNSKNNSYIIKLERWSNYKEVEQYIIEEYNIEPASHVINTSNIDLDQIIKNFSTYVYIIIGIFIIVFVFTIYNIINDEKKKIYIYRSLGYSRSNIFTKQLINIGSMFGISLICSGILITIIDSFMI